MSSKNRSGQVKKTVKVVTNDPASPKTVLRVRADVKVVLGLRPSRLYLGEIAKGEVVEKSVELIGEEAAGAKLLSADGGERFEVAMLEETGAAGRRMLKLTFSPKPPLRQGRVRGRIEIETSHPEKRHLQLAVSGRVVERNGTRP